MIIATNKKWNPAYRLPYQSRMFAKQTSTLFPKRKIGQTFLRMSTLLVFLLINAISFAQLTEELNDILYDIGYRCATTDIDPIEGTYSVSIESKLLLNNEVVSKKHFDGDITIYSNSKGNIRDYNNKFEFCRIGKTQTYDVDVLWPQCDVVQHERIRIKNTNFFDVSFSLTYELPQSELRNKFGDFYASGLKVVHSLLCKKTLPDKALVDGVMSLLKIRKDSETLVWTGTGFSITNNMVATNFHVIDNAKSIYITNEVIKDTIPAAMVVSSKEKDIAILSVETRNLPQQKYKITQDPQKVGTSIFVLGYPLTSTMGNEIKATSGIVSSQSGYKGDNNLYQISAPIQPGNSGGPVFDLSGNVIGIVCAHHTQAENVGYAIKGKYLMELCSDNDICINNQKLNVEGNNKDLSGLIEKFKPNLFQIICINK